MLVTNTVFKNRYIYNGQTSFPISFPFLDANHVEVWWSVPGSADTNAQLMDRGTFTISGVGNPAGGTLTRTGDWTMGATIAIVRNVPITQLHQYTQYDDFPAESHEDALAKLTMICQEQKEILDRAMTVPVTSDNNPQEYWLEIIEQNKIAVGAAASAQDAANKAKECRVQACDCAASAQATETRINEAVQGQLDSITELGQTQLNSIQTEGDSAVRVITNESNTQVQRIQAEGFTQEQRIVSHGDDQYDKIDTLGKGYINSITSTGSEYLTNINAAGKSNIEQITGTTSTIITQITDTGNFQTARVSSIGDDTVQRVREETNIVVGEANRAKREADRAKEEADRAQHVALGELPVATQVIQGITRLATTEEHLAGADNTIATTPLGVRQMVQQFTSVTIQGPTITGPDNVREASTHAYAFYAKALLPEAKIAKFIYHFDELASDPIEAPVPTASQAAEVTLNVDITFPGGLGTINTLIVYAIDSYGNTSKYAMKPVTIRLNEPPVMDDFTHNIPAFVNRFTTYTIQMSGAVDPDNDPVTYSFDFGSTGITAVPASGITDNQNVIITIPKIVHSANPTPLTFKVIATDSIGATNEVSITVNIISMFKTPSIGAPTAGQLDFSPKGTIAWSNYVIDHNVAVPNLTEIEIATNAAFTNKVVSQQLSGALTSWTGTLPYNQQLYVHVRYITSASNTYSNWSPTVNFTTKVVTPVPVMNIYQGTSSMTACRGDLLAPGDTITAADINNNLIGVSYSLSNNAVTPTGEMPINVTFQAAASQDFADPYTTDMTIAETPTQPICNTGVMEAALTAGKITAGYPAKLAYFRIRFKYGTVGPAGHTTDLVSAWSAVQSNSILSASLTAPVLTSPANGAIDQNESSLTLSWNNGTVIGQNITRVQVQVYDDITMSTIVKDSGNLAGTATSWTVTGLALGHEYYWRVRNYGDATGWSAWSTERRFTTFEYLFKTGINFASPAGNATMIPRKQTLTVIWRAPTYDHGDLSLDSVKYNLAIKRSTQVIYTKENITTERLVIPANTMPAANTTYTILVVAYFNASKVNSSDRHYTTNGSINITTSPATVNQMFRESGTYTVPYTGQYFLTVLGAGGWGGLTGTSSGTYGGTSAIGGGGAGGYARGLIQLTKGTVLTVAVGAGGTYTLNDNGIVNGGTPGGASYFDESTHRAQIIGHGGNPGVWSSESNGGGGAGGTTVVGSGFTDQVTYTGGNGGAGTFAKVNVDYICQRSGGPGTLTGNCSGNSVGNVGQGGVSICQDLTGMGTWLIISGPGGGGGICTPFAYGVGGGGGYQQGNLPDPTVGEGTDTTKNGQPGIAHIESAWSE